MRQIQTTLDDCISTSDDEVVEGEIEEGRLYEEPDFNRSIEIQAREKKRVELLTPLLRLKDQNSIADAVADLGKPEEIGKASAGFQKYLYPAVA